MILPPVPDLPTWRAIFNDHALTLPAAAHILTTHHLGDPSTLRRADTGTHLVFHLGDTGPLLKLYTPLFPHDYAVEATLLPALARRLPVRTPEILASGTLEGWPWLLLSRLHGLPIGAVLPTLDATTARPLIAQIADLVRALHALPLDPLTPLAPPWPTLLATTRAALPTRHATLPAPWLDALSPILDAHLDPDAPSAFLHADLTDEHLLLEHHNGAWTLTGLLDLADATPAPPAYDLYALTMGALHARHDLIPLLLTELNLLPTDDPAWLRHHLLAFTAIHRFSSLARRVPADLLANPTPDWDRAARRIFGI